IRYAGPIASLPGMGCSACRQPMKRLVSPLVGKTTGRRAGCGRPAHPVQREGEAGQQPLLPTPIVHRRLYSLRSDPTDRGWVAGMRPATAERTVAERADSVQAGAYPDLITYLPQPPSA